MIHSCGDDDALPDIGYACCMGSAVGGPKRCTCWEDHHDIEQAEVQPGEMTPRDEMCHDCAFRPGSPERNGDKGYAHNSEEDREDLFDPGHVFVCHQGMRKVTHRTHPESDLVVPGHPAAYDPPTQEGVSYKADGTPADICAGWAARSRVRKQT